jgi:hypothetical protein
MMKKIILLMTALVLAIPFAGVGMAAPAMRTFVITEGSPLIQVDGESYVGYIAPFSTTNKLYEQVAPENKLLISVMDFCRMLGGKVDYDTPKMMIIFKTCNVKIGLGYNSNNQIYIDDKPMSVPIALLTDGGRSALSPKIICDALGCKAEYDEETKSLTFQLPVCTFGMSPYAAHHAYAKVNSVDQESKKMLVTDFLGTLFEIDLEGVNQELAAGDIVHLYFMQKEEGLPKPYLLEKVAIPFGGGSAKIFIDSEEVIINGSKQYARGKSILLDGTHYIPLETMSLISNSTVLPGDLGAGQLTLYSKLNQIGVWIDSKKVEIKNAEGNLLKTIEIEKPCVYVNGIVYIPVSALTQWPGGKSTTSPDGKSIEIIFDKLFYPTYSGTKMATLDAVDCANNTATLSLQNDDKIQALIMPQPAKAGYAIKCEELKAGIKYLTALETFETNNGSLKHFLLGCMQTKTNNLTPINERLVTGTIVEIIDVSKFKFKIDCDEDKLYDFSGNTKTLKVGWKIKAILLKASEKTSYVMDYVVIDPQTSKNMISISLMLEKNGKVWIGTDDDGKAYELVFKDVPWSIAKYLETGEKYIIKGFEPELGIINVVDFAKSQKSLFEKQTISCDYEGKKKTNIMQAFKYNGKTYVNIVSVAKTQVIRSYPDISVADDDLNIATITLGSRKAVYRDKEIELSTYPISIGYFNFNYLEISDARKITNAKIEETEDGKIIITKPNSRLAVTNDFVLTATVDSIDENSLTLKGTDEFGRPANIMFFEKADIAGLEIGKSYAFSCKNIDWNNYIAFKTFGAQKFCEYKPHKIIFGTIDSVDSQTQSIQVVDKDKAAYSCLLKKDDNDCALLKPGQNVAIDSNANEDGTISIIKKWHYNTIPEAVTRTYKLIPGEFIKDALTDKALTQHTRIAEIDGQYYIDLYTAYSVFGSIRSAGSYGSNRVELMADNKIVVLWPEKDSCIVNGKLERLPSKVLMVNGIAMLPVNVLLSCYGGKSEMAEDGKSMTIETAICPIPFWHNLVPLPVTFTITRVDGYDVFTEISNKDYPIRIGDLRQLEGLAAGSCAKMTLTTSVVDMNTFSFFADTLSIVDCPEQ